MKKIYFVFVFILGHSLALGKDIADYIIEGDADALVSLQQLTHCNVYIKSADKQKYIQIAQRMLELRKINDMVDKAIQRISPGAEAALGLTCYLASSIASVANWSFIEPGVTDYWQDKSNSDRKKLAVFFAGVSLASLGLFFHALSRWAEEQKYSNARLILELIKKFPTIDSARA